MIPLGIFSSIIEFFNLLIDWISNLVSGIINFFGMIGSAVSMPVLLSGYCWSYVSTAVMAVSAVAILKLIIGRENK